MKNHLIAITVLMFSYSLSNAQSSKNLIIPANPTPGQTVNFTYNPAGTELGKEKQFDAIVYVFDTLIKASEIKLIEKAGKWTGSIPTTKHTKAVFLVFRKDKLIDNNKGNGYWTMFYKNGQPVKGSIATIGEIGSGIGAFAMQLTIDPKESISMLDQEFERHPDLLTRYLFSYALLQAKIDRSTAYENMRGLINKAIAKENKNENEYGQIVQTLQIFKQRDSMALIKKEALSKFPNGSLARGDRQMAFYGEKDLKKQELLLSDYAKDYPPNDKLSKIVLNNLYTFFAEEAARKKEWELFKKYESLNTDKEMGARMLNSVAWNLSGGDIDKEAIDLTLAKNLSAKSLKNIEDLLNSTALGLDIFTEKEYKKNLENTLGLYEDTYALLLWKAGEKESALMHQAAAIKKMKFPSADVNERYILFKSMLKGVSTVKSEVIEQIKTGKSSPKMRALLKDIYLSEGNKEESFDKYVDEIINSYRIKLREDLVKKIINKPAPKFSLKDLDGKQVSLDELKGKIVVVDFWATWCGPCIASFPGMQLALTKYKDDPNVKFVFVDTWENKGSEEMQKGASSFITKNKYNFHVLLDSDDKVVSNFNVDGIPTKFIIDGDGNIRYRADGYEGSIDKLVEEISIIIEELKKPKA